LIFSLEMLRPHFEALERCRGVEQLEVYHPEGDVFIHSLQVLQWAFKETIDTDLILAAMLHDIGKVENSLGHEHIAIEMIGELLSVKTCWLIEQHMRIWYLLNGEMRKLSKIKELVDHPFLPELILLARWDKLGRYPKRKVLYSKQMIVDRLNYCAEEHFKTIDKE